MKIAGVCTAYHEADILPWTVQHLLAEGIDHVWIEVPLGDRETIAAMKGIDNCTVTPYLELYHDQPHSINRMANQAASYFGEELWIVPFDADEFWYATDLNKTIRQVLEETEPDIGVLENYMYQHHDWNSREWELKPMGKVAYRFHPDASIRPGNHGVDNVPGTPVRLNTIAIREIQYQSFEHFCRKVEERNRTLDPKAGPYQGIHMTKLKGMSEWKLAIEWEKMETSPLIWDPIPSRIVPPEHLSPPIEHLSIDKLFEVMINTPCDISGHMERLRELSTGKRVLEIGVNTGMSTIAFMAGKPSEMFSVDITRVRVRPEIQQIWDDSEEDRYFVLGDDLELANWFEGDLFDVVFIDTTHTMRQTVQEFVAYEPKVKPGGCMIWHDTESYPEEALALQHCMHVLEESGRVPTHVEKYSHSQGLWVIWLP